MPIRLRGCGRRNRSEELTFQRHNQFWGDRGGAVSDPEGYIWWIATHKEDLSREELKKRAEEMFKQMA